MSESIDGESPKVVIVDHNGNGLSDELELSFAIEKKKWNYRRKIAFQSLYYAIAISISSMAMALYSDDMNSRIDTISDMIVWIVAALISLTGIYMGASTYYDVSKFKSRGKGE